MGQKLEWPCGVWSHLSEFPKIDKFIETESKYMLPGAQEEGGGWLLMGTVFLLGARMFWKLTEVMSAQPCEGLIGPQTVHFVKVSG